MVPEEALAPEEALIPPAEAVIPPPPPEIPIPEGLLTAAAVGGHPRCGCRDPAASAGHAASLRPGTPDSPHPRRRGAGRSGRGLGAAVGRARGSDVRRLRRVRGRDLRVPVPAARRRDRRDRGAAEHGRAALRVRSRRAPVRPRAAGLDVAQAFVCRRRSAAEATATTVPTATPITVSIARSCRSTSTGVGAARCTMSRASGVMNTIAMP